MTKLPHDRSDLLWSGGEPTPLFLGSIDRWVDAMVADEHGGGDGPDGLVEARITAKAPGFLCGRPVAERLLERHFPECSIQWGPAEGGAVAKGDTVATLQGPAVDILRLERIVLNLLGRLSGIATNTARWVAAAKPMQVAATRKTEWGLLDKWAVHVGGGLTHRLDRNDTLMLKENDFVALAEKDEEMCATIKRVISTIDMDAHAGFTVVEVRDRNQAQTAVWAWRNSQLARGGEERLVIMLDNMKPDIAWDVYSSIRIWSLNGKIRRPFILEASGGIVFESLEDWNSVGVDIVSSSALNMGVRPLDMSMLIGGGE